MGIAYQDFAQALQGVAAELLTDGKPSRGVGDPSSVGSDFGTRNRPTVELLAHQFTVRDPRSAFIATQARETDPVYAIAQWIWTLAGSCDADAIGHYNPRAWAFSNDSGELPGAFGWRLLQAGGTSQLDRVVDLLRRDPQSRRAVAIISEPSDAGTASHDQPCAISLQYLIRADRLEAITTMRSQSAVMVLPYDGFLFAAIQVWLAARLGLEPGHYHHQSGSMHFYEEERPLVDAVVASDPVALPFGPMPGPERELRELISWESELRQACKNRDEAEVAALSGPPNDSGTFWGQCRAVLASDALTRFDRFEDAAEVRRTLGPEWERLLAPASSSRATSKQTLRRRSLIRR